MNALARPLPRRQFLQVASTAVAVAASRSCFAADDSSSLAGEIGITTGSFSTHMSAEPARGKLRMLDLPKRMKNEMGMKVIDLMTRTLASFEPAYLDALRNEAEKHGCILTNLKLNDPRDQPPRDIGSTDDALRRRSIDEYKQTIDAAARLGVRWVRPGAGRKRDDMPRIVDGYRELIEYSAPHGISLLIENNSWLSRDPDAIPDLIAAIGQGVAAQPDAGNWSDEVRYEGLAKAFPKAVSCDFKAFAMDADGRHAQYDLERCFRIGWDAGFRGPWCLEHANTDLDQTFREMAMLRDQLQAWMRG